MKKLNSLCMMALFVTTAAFAQGQSLGDIAHNITQSMDNIARLITAASYVAGVAFALMGMMKFKAHKDNPTQVPLSQPIVLLAIATGLVFLPSLINTTGQTVWGTQAKYATSHGGGLLGTSGV